MVILFIYIFFKILVLFSSGLGPKEAKASDKVTRSSLAFGFKKV
jgi:hypothetical protein